MGVRNEQSAKCVMKPILTGWSLFVVVFARTATMSAQEPMILESRGMIDIWSVPQVPPAPGFHATKLVVKAQNPEAQIVTLAFLGIDGPLHQIWKTTDGGEQSTPVVTDWQLPDDGGLAVFDSHFLLPGLAGFRVHDGFDGWIEDREAQPIGCEALEYLPVEDCNVTGTGGIRTGSITNAVWFDAGFQDSEVDLAYVVLAPGAAASEIALSLGVYGAGFISAEPEPNGALWGFGGAEPLRFVIPEPATRTTLILAAFGVLTLCRGREVGLVRV